MKNRSRLQGFHAIPQSASPLGSYPEAFSPRSQQALRRLLLDAVIADDAVRLVPKTVSDGKQLAIPLETTHLAEQVTPRRGFDPVFVDISELRKSGGGLKCCAMELRG